MIDKLQTHKAMIAYGQGILKGAMHLRMNGGSPNYKWLEDYQAPF